MPKRVAGEGAPENRRRRRWRSRWSSYPSSTTLRELSLVVLTHRVVVRTRGASASGPAELGDYPARCRPDGGERPEIAPRPESTRDQRRIRRDRSRADVKRESRKCLSRRSDPLFGDDRAGGPATRVRLERWPDPRVTVTSEIAVAADRCFEKNFDSRGISRGKFRFATSVDRDAASRASPAFRPVSGPSPKPRSPRIREEG